MSVSAPIIKPSANPIFLPESLDLEKAGPNIGPVLQRFSEQSNQLPAAAAAAHSKGKKRSLRDETEQELPTDETDKKKAHKNPPVSILLMLQSASRSASSSTATEESKSSELSTELDSSPISMDELSLSSSCTHNPSPSGELLDDSMGSKP